MDGIVYKRYFIGLSIISLLTLIAGILALLIRMQDGCEGITYGDMEYYTQLWYNFSHGFPFVQSSYYINPAAGYTGNTYSYINMFAIHATVSSHVIAILSLFFPDVDGLLAAHLIFIYVVTGFYGWRLCVISSKNKDEAIFAYSVFIIALCVPGLLENLSFAAMPLGMTIPFMVAAVFYLRCEKFWPFYLFIILTLLTSEDASLLTGSFAVYIFLFENKKMRFSLVPFATSIAYLAFVIFIAQPHARADLVTSNGSYVAAAIYRVFSPASPISIWHADWWSAQYASLGHMKSLFIILSMAFIPGLVTGDRRSLLRGAAFIFVGGGGIWAMNLVWGIWAGIHHLSPLVALAIALVALQTCANRINPFNREGRAALICLALICTFASFGELRQIYTESSISVRALAKDVLDADIGLTRTVAIYRGRYGEACNIKSNFEVRRIISRIPRNQSVSYLTHPDLGAWIASRNAYWRYPDLYDKADYLVLQNNIQALVAVDTHIPMSNASRVVETKDIIGNLYQELVIREDLYSVYYDSENVLILERKTRYENEIPRQLIGFNFLLR
jgi:hypothetical protein